MKKKISSSPLYPFLLALFFIGFHIRCTAQTNLYSGGSGTISAITWYTSQTRVGATSIPSVTSILNVGSNHTVTLPNTTTATYAGIIVNDNGGGGIFQFGSNSGNGSTLTITGDIVVKSGGTFRDGGNGGDNYNLYLRGNFENDNIVDFTIGLANHYMNFTGSTSGQNQQLKGTGTYSFERVVFATGTNVNVDATRSFSVTTNVNFSTDCILSVNASSNITLTSAATLTGTFGANRHIRLDGTSSSGSQLIKQTAAATTGSTSWRILYPVGTEDGGYTPLDLSAATLTNNPTVNASLSVKPLYNQSVPGQLRRQFRLVVSGNTGNTTLHSGRFYYTESTDLSTGDNLSSYTLIRYTNSVNVTSIIAGTAPGSGYFTAPASTAAQSLNTGTSYFSIGSSAVWYTYQDGVWSNWEVWTQDPSGTTLLNPLTQIPLPGDQVVILNGYTITADINNISLTSTSIEGGGTLDIGTTTSHNLGQIDGTGLLRMNGVNLPGGTYSSFVSDEGGTIEYYNTSGSLPVAQTIYNNLLLTNSVNSATLFTTLNNLTVNGDFGIRQTGGSGTVTWRINDGTNANRAMSIYGDLSVSVGGQIRVGIGNEGTDATLQHSLTLYGDLSNSGSIKFFDDLDTELAVANYTNSTSNANRITANELQGNAVNVSFVANEDQTVSCNGETDFYRLIVNKGTGRQAILTINSSDVANFRLFGPTNRSNNVADGTSVSANSLSLINGTLQLTGSINIISLAESSPCAFEFGGTCFVQDVGGGWPIPEDAALWVNGANVSIQATNSTDTRDNGRQVYVFGLLKISKGTFSLGFSRGLLGGGSGVVVIEGGTLNAWQIRTTYLGSNNRFAYLQRGGTVNVATSGITGVQVNTYPRFALPYAECTFEMTDGILNVAEPMNSGTAVNGGILIFAAPSNILVSGGTVNAMLPPTNINFDISTTAPFYNLTISKTGAANSSACRLNAMAFDDNTLYNLAAQPLTVQNDLTITGSNTPSFNCNSQDLTIGGDFVIGSNTTFATGTNTLTVNGTLDQNWSNDGTISSLSNIIINKTGVLTLAGSTAFPNITGLTLSSGTLNDGGKTLTVTSILSNSAAHTGTGLILANGPKYILGANGIFGNLTIQTDTTVSTMGAQTINGNLRLTNTNSTVNIGSHNLTVVGKIYSDLASGESFSAAKHIHTNGLRNDGGLTRKGAAGNLLFPVGTLVAAYSPVTLDVTASTHGSITVRPVSTAHPNAIPVGQSLNYYWRVTSKNYQVVTAVSHNSYTYGNAALLSGSLTLYKPALYVESNFTWSIGTQYDATGRTNIPNFSFSTTIDGEYTAGNITPGTLSVFYSRQSGLWNSNTTWSYSPCTGSNTCGTAVPAATFPCASCPVVIGDTNNNHVVNIDANNRGCGSLQITTGSTIDCGGFTGLNFGANNGDDITGRGTLRISSNVFPMGDFSNFVGAEGGTVEWYGNTRTLIATGPAPQNLNLSSYYNLVLSPDAAQTITLPPTSLTIYNTLTKSGAGTTATNGTGVRTISIKGNLHVTSGIFATASSNVSNFIIEGNTTISSGAAFQPINTSTRVHTITTLGSIINDGTFTLRSSNHVINLTFTGSNDASITGTNSAALTTLNAVIINKGTSQLPKVTLDVAGTLTLQTTGWLTLLNGNIVFNKPGSTVSIHTAVSSYSIPATAKLTVKSGTVNIIGNVNDNAGDLLLAGTLEVAGGDVNINPLATNRNINNDIEYSSAGTPSIIVSSGNLYVNGGIRRPFTTLSGALVYNQSGGTVVVGGRNSSVQNTRGVFEIENNAGSNFTQTGTGVLTINRSAGATSSFADIYVNPETSFVESTSTIQIGIASGAVTSPLSINIVPVIGNLSILGNTNAQVVNIRSSNLNTSGTLAVNTNTSLITNSLDVTIGKDLTIDGLYNGTIGTGNTTTFNGSGLQSAKLSAASTFENVTINKPTGTVTLSGVSPTIKNLNILSGVLDVAGLGLTVEGNVVNNSSQIGAGAIILSGASFIQYITSVNGSFTNLTLAGSSTSKNVKLSGNVTFLGALTFAQDNRYLSIGSSMVTFGATASTVGAGNLRFIRTNGAASDLGVMKKWEVGTTSFTYEIGVLNYYTPVALTLDVTTAGTFGIVPVNQRHPTSNLGSSESILNYYWAVARDNSIVYNPTGSHTYKYPAGLITGTGGTLVAGYLDITDPEGWETSLHGGSATTTLMTFTNLLSSNLPTLGNLFHYTVGTTGTLPNPIEPIYSRLDDPSVSNLSVGGSWTSPASWTTSSSGHGDPLSGAPALGTPAVILANSRININATARSAVTTRVDGLLVVGTTLQHNLGVLSGTGTMQVSTNTFPAGNYSTFVSSSGGTIQYVGPMTMNNRSVYNNLSITGGGNVTMTNADLTLNGSLMISSGSTLVNTNNRAISVAKNWINNGNFTAGLGTLTLSGNTDQDIEGASTLYNVVVNKSGGNVYLSGSGATTVTNNATLTSGHVITSANHMLVINSSATLSGGSSTSFISGPARKLLFAGSSATIPIGDLSTNRYRPMSIFDTSTGDTWTVQYFASNPTASGYSNTLLNSDNIKSVSMYEYWNVQRSGISSAGLSFTYNTGSYTSPDIGNLADLRIAHWDGTKWDLPTGSGVVSQNGTNVTGTVSVTNVTTFSPFTFASMIQHSALPVTWLDFSAERVSSSIHLQWRTAMEKNSDYFEVERSVDGKTFVAIGTTKAAGSTRNVSTYSFIDSNIVLSEKYYYRIRQVDVDRRTDFSRVIVVSPEESDITSAWTVYPNPVNAYEDIVIQFTGLIAQSNIKISLLNVSGKHISDFTGTLENVSNQLNQLITNLPSAMYILKIRNEERMETFRIVKL